MGKKEIYCEKCSGQINDREELVTSTVFFFVAPFHEQCFSKSLKGWQTIYLGNVPINGLSGNIRALVALIAAIILFLTTNGTYTLISILLLIVPILRLYSWLAYERYVD